MYLITNKDLNTQILFHPYVYEEQRPILDICISRDIVVEAYSPLMYGIYYLCQNSC